MLRFEGTGAARYAWPIAAALAVGFALLFVPVRSARAEPDFDTGAVLLAAVPGFRQPGWVHSVVLAAPLPEGGHVGVILNHATSYPLAALFPGYEPARKVVEPVSIGGPFLSHAVVAVTSKTFGSREGMAPLGRGLFLHYTEEALDRVIEQAPNDARYFVGIVIWRPNELRSELEQGMWTVHEAESKTVFRKDVELLWPELSTAARWLKI